jgi:hypothetical protein
MAAIGFLFAGRAQATQPTMQIPAPVQQKPAAPAGHH